MCFCLSACGFISFLDCVQMCETFLKGITIVGVVAAVAVTIVARATNVCKC